jgi:type II restriction/modification system DNA methylase subunit YeeA
LRFLDAYNFNTEGTAEVQKEAKTLINASVLGRIFEKINGYKDGSFFTPGYITEYMCRETIRRAVVQKFNETYESWNCEDIDEVAARISRHEIPYDKANEIVNSITICDPAVGSGHFLVSALNELIAIKSDLRIFVDEDNHRIRDVEISVDNDELSISVGQDPFFEYRVHSEWKENGTIERTVGPDTQRLQKALFREKNILIENCLFGVDINPNSVNICRLRLWIELLKHAYYKESTDFQQLEVLPNIDINIKQGNSLVSRFNLDADLSQILANNDDLTIEEYKQAVRSYKETGDREDKRALKEQINSIKESFSVGLKELHPVRQKLKKQREILIKEEAKLDLFEGDKKSKKEQKKIAKTKKKVGKLEEELEELENATFYDQAFEWRFEFPEVLDEEGIFTGFDAVIGNPPYIRQELLKDIKPYLKDNYEVYYGSADLYQYFVQKGVEILRDKGYFHYIISKKWMRTNYGKPLREWAQNYQIKSIIDFGDLPVFEAATVYPCLLQIQNTNSESSFKAAEVEHLDFQDLSGYLSEVKFSVDQEKLQLSGWSLIDERSQKLLNKLKEIGTSLAEYVDQKIYRGIVTGYNKAFIIDQETKEKLISQDSTSAELIKPFLRGRDIKRYQQPEADEYVLFTRRGVEIEDYPAILNYLEGYKESLEPRPTDVDSSDWDGRKPGSYEWYEIQDTIDYYEEFEKPKIIIPAIVKSANYAFDTENMYSNDKTTIISKDDKYLLGTLNSKLSDFFIFNISNTKRGGYYEYKPMYVEKIPIVEPSDEDRKKIESFVEQILTAKKDNPKADTSELEEEIDQLVYKLYDLSEEEIEIVEESVG